jgi:arabinofuranosyltransferase
MCCDEGRKAFQLPPRQTWAGIVAIALAVAVLCEAWLKFYSYQDDAFIFFRYAENALSGQGLVFNPGERVEGFSSPLWLLLLVLAGAAGLSPLHAAGIFGALATLAVVLLSIRDARRCGPPGPLSFLAPIGLVLFFPFLAWSVSGMETSLFTALVWGALSGHRIARAEGRRPGRDVGFCLAGAVLTRPEAVLLVLAFLADEFVAARSQSTVTGGAREREAPWRWTARLSWLLPTLLAGGGLLVARLSYYGALLPNTYYAKLGGGAAHAGFGLRYLGDFVIAAPLIVPAALLLVPRFARRVPGGVAALVLVVLWSSNLLWLGGDHFGYHRFLIPLAPMLFALGATGLHETWLRLSPHIDAGRRRPLGAALLLGCLGFVALAAPDPALGKDQHGFDWTLASARLGQRLAAALPPSTVVALPHIGAVGYYSHLPVLDLLGLVDGELARRPRTGGPPRGFNDIGHECFDIAWSLSHRPAVVVPSRTYGSRPFTNVSELGPDFQAEAQLFEAMGRRNDYRLINVRIGDGGVWGLFLRRDLDESLLTAPVPR